MIGINAFFGDKERPFTLTDPMLIELEAKTGAGIGVLFQRLMANQFHLGDLSEILRLGLIGAGTSPDQADRLVNAYAKDRPISEILPLALDVITARWLGADEMKADA